MYQQHHFSGIFLYQTAAPNADSNIYSAAILFSITLYYAMQSQKPKNIVLTKIIPVALQ